MDHRFEDVHPCLPSAWENWDFNSLPPKWPGDIGNYLKLLSKGLNLPITSCLRANNWDFYKKQHIVSYCGMHTTTIHLRALDPKWSAFRNKKGISPDRYNTKPWNCTPKLGGLYWLFPPKKFEATTSPQVGVQFLMSNECRVLMLRIWDTFFRSMTLMLDQTALVGLSSGGKAILGAYVATPLIWLYWKLCPLPYYTTSLYPK